MKSAMKLLCVIEATTVTGPAKNLLSFCRLVRSPEFCGNGVPRVEVSIVTFDRQNVSEPRAGRGPHAGSPRGVVDATGSFGSTFAFDPIATAPGSDTLGGAPNAFVTAAREAGVSVDVIRERFRFDPQALTELRAIVDRRAPDIIQTHMIKSHFLIKLTGLGKKYPWIAYHHGYTTTDLKMQFYNQFNRWSLPSAGKVVTVCGAFANQLTRTGVSAERIAICHNSVVALRRATVDERLALKDRVEIAGDEKVVLAVGRLSREKGHADLIAALVELREIDPALKFKLVVVGDGPEGGRLEQAVTDLGLQERVRFIGHVDDVAPYYSIADVLALPSHSEGSPNVLLEAMAAGVPVAATNVGGVPEIAVSEKNALLVPAQRPRLFAEALHRVLTDSKLAQTLSLNAAAHVAAHFSPAAQAKSVIRIYEELLSEPREVATGSNAQPSLYDPVATAPGCDSSF